MYMSELEKQYDNAIDLVEQHLLPKLKPEEIYQLYGIHKQCLAGDCKEPKPSAFANERWTQTKIMDRLVKMRWDDTKAMHVEVH